MRTIEELERLMYIEGRTEEARLLGAALDAGRDMPKENDLKARVDELNEENNDLKARADELNDTLGRIENMCRGARRT